VSLDFENQFKSTISLGRLESNFSHLFV